MPFLLVILLFGYIKQILFFHSFIYNSEKTFTFNPTPNKSQGSLYMMKQTLFTFWTN